VKRVFVSYSRHNQDAVGQIVHDLNAVGVQTWHDQALSGGQPWWDKILANIRDCDIFLFALSPESLDSEACKSELAYVVQLGKPILPILVADGINLNLLSHPLSEIQIADCRKGDKESVFTLVKSIMSAPPTPPLPDPLPNPPRVPVSYLSGVNDRIESSEPLTAQEQRNLLYELEEELREGRSPKEVRDLMLKLKRRDDLLARFAKKIDESLEALDNKPVARPRANGAPATPVRQEPVRRGFGTELAPRLCPQCRTEVEAESKFCRNCGAALEATRAVSPAAKVPTIPGSKSRRYALPADENPQLIADVKRWLESEDFDTQELSTDENGLLLQIKKRGGWRNLVGMATSLNIVFYQSNDTLNVQIGAGKWIDKVGAAGVSLFVLWPLAITAGVGAWEQMKLPDKIFDYIGRRLASK
jgi:TIR domain/zinc-ribbon domain